MTFANLRPAHWAVFVAALVLLFVGAMDWYSTVQGEEARRIERLASPDDGLSSEPERVVDERARERAEEAEKNVWQVSGAIDRLIQLGLILTVALGVGGAFLVARRPDATAAIGLAGVAATVTALLVAYRIVQEPGADEATVVKAGAPLALVVLGVVALASAAALRAEPSPKSRAEG